ncbi:epsin-3-like [Hyperolius riggenbachi]|uniref:epsin-3-like n=1 Tax=Hyperolius riggenbachi TaxID=752182 RepID=UPI0035A2DCAF
MASSSLRRQMKNIVHNYSEAEVKVREATSNDPWGPSTTLMSEIAQMTYQGETYQEVMIMVWKRLNDSGKNWRHVYKGLTLLDYLIKNGPNKVVQECNENIFSVQTLKDFQFFDRDGKDNGINVREKAKQIVALLKDEERLKQERAQAQATRRRMSQVTSALDNRHRIRFNEGSVSDLSPDLEQARPQSTGEEELQLQLALAMSREEAEKKKEPSAPEADEETQLQAALSQSKEEFEKETKFRQGEISIIEKALIDTHLSEHGVQEPVKKKETHMSDLMDIFGPPPSSSSNVWDSQHASSLPPPSSDAFFSAWGAPNQSMSTSASSLPWDIVSHGTQLKADNTSQSIIFGCEAPSNWEEPQATKSSSSDPWGEKQKDPEKVIYDIFSPPSPAQDTQSPSSIKTDNSFELDFLGDFLPTITKPAIDSPELKAEEPLPDPSAKPRPKTPELFLEPAARSLVNLNSLIVPETSIKVKNPFLSGPATASPPNPFQIGDLRPSLNQMRTTSPVPVPITGPPPMLAPMPANTMDNGMNALRTLPPMSGFPMVSSSSIPVHPFPTTVPLQPALSYQYAPYPVLNQLPVSLPQPIMPGPGSPKAGTNPFL